VRVGYVLVGLAIASAAFGDAFRHGTRWAVAASCLYVELTLVGRARRKLR
jgi:hypothetical protein